MSNLTLTIEALGGQGDGIAHQNGKTLFISGALPGEQVRIEGETGRLLEVLKPSPERAEPPCPHFPACGGCRFQHLKREAYAKHKQEQLALLLRRGSLDAVTILSPVITAPGTRRRARLVALRTAKGVLLGFNGWHSHQIINVGHCPVLLPDLEKAIAPLRRALETWLPVRATCDVQLTLLDDGLDVLFIGGPPLDLAARESLGAMAGTLDVGHLSWQPKDHSPIEPLAHRKALRLRLGETLVPFPPGSFLQATETAERALTAFARSYVRDGAKLLDLFSGLGTFGLSLTAAASVTFADSDGPAIEALKAATRSNPAYTVLKRHLMRDPFSAEECAAFDVILFDPPRGGAKAQAEQIAQSNVKTVIAISCDPASFIRDAQILKEGGYKLETLQPVDQFLWSPHLELAALFVRI